MSASKDNEQPFAADGGLASSRTESGRDPFAILDDLMTVVEALCPSWPHRGTFASSSKFLL